MARTGSAKFMALSPTEAIQFMEDKSILSQGTILYLTEQLDSVQEVFFGIGKTLDESPGFSRHTIAQVAGLLAGTLTGPHTHAISDVVNLQATLDTKSVIGHNHDDRYYTESEMDSTIGTLTGIINSKADIVHTHSISDVTNLQTTLDDLQTQINAKSDYVPGETNVDEGLIT